MSAKLNCLAYVTLLSYRFSLILSFIMQIVLNGEQTQLPDNLSAAGLIEHLKLTGQRVALEINQEIVPRSQYAEVTIQVDDKVEIVHAIGGG